MGTPISSDKRLNGNGGKGVLGAHDPREFYHGIVWGAGRRCSGALTWNHGYGHWLPGLDFERQQERALPGGRSCA